MLVIIGDVGYDIRPKEYGVSKFFGGSGYHAVAGTLAAGKKPSIVIACVGNDFNLSEFSRLGINTHYIVQMEHEITSRFNIYYENNIRNVVFEMGASQYECIECIDDKVISSDLIHLTATRPEKQMKYIEKLRKEGFSGLISADVFDQFCRECPSPVLDVLEECDIIFMNADEKDILGIVPEYYWEKGKMFILKKANDGAECYYKNQHVHAYSPAKNRVVDTTGAGDIMAGAFLSLLDAGESIQQALDLSVELATKSVQFWGSEAFLSALLRWKKSV